MSDEIKTVNAFNRNDFRKWLQKNHKKEKRVGVILYKKHTGKTSPSHRELIEEAICFGWIDTIIKRIDEDTYMRNFTKRTQNSSWSDNTLSYAKDLVSRGMMMPEGMKYYKMGLEKPTHDHGIPKNPDIPDDLQKAILKDKKAMKTFSGVSPSKKRMFYR